MDVTTESLLNGIVDPVKAEQQRVLLKQFEAKNSNPELATLLGSVRVVPNGEGLEMSLAVSSDQVVNLIKRNAFSAKH